MMIEGSGSGSRFGSGTLVSTPLYSVILIISRSLEAWQRGVMYSIVDSLIYGNILYDLGTVCLFPCWILIYLIAFASSADPPTSDDAKSKTD